MIIFLRNVVFILPTGGYLKQICRSEGWWNKGMVKYETGFDNKEWLVVQGWYKGQVRDNPGFEDT